MGNIAHDHLISVQTIPGCIEVGEAIKGVAVAGFDCIKPCLLDWKAQAGVIESNQGTNAREIKAAWVEWSICNTGFQGNTLRCTIQIVDQAGYPRHAGGKDALARIRVGCPRHGWRSDQWGWWGHLRDTGWWRMKWSKSWDGLPRSCGIGCILGVGGLGGERKVPETRTSLTPPA